MRTLIQNLQDLDPGYIKIISELWGVDLPEGEVRDDPESLAHIMLDPRRRILRKIAENETDKIGDVTTLADPSVVQDLVDNRPQA